MAGSVKFVGKEIWTDLNGLQKERPYSKTITCANGAEERIYSLATATELTVWNPTVDTSEAGATFVYLRVVSDQDVMLLTVTDIGGEVGSVWGTHELVKGLPFQLGSDTSYANGSDNSFTGTLDVHDQIRIRNDSGSTAIISVLIGT